MRVLAMSSAALVLIASAVRPSRVHAQCTAPGKERWPIKSSVTDLSAQPLEVPLADLLALADATGVKHNDPRFQSARIPDAADGKALKEGQIVSTTGFLHLVATEGNDCEYHIQISESPTDGNHCLIVEIGRDDSTSIADPALRAKATAVREFVRTKLLNGKEPVGSGNVMQHQVFVRVTGQLFFDDAHVGDQPRGKRGMKAATLWEIHPITSLEFAATP